jgi:DNA (cytosine-5)-methyltransferase 1
MNILSLFDGISCGQLALKKSEIKYENYFSSEIDKNGIKVTQHHFPNTIQLGDVKNIKPKDLPKIDLLIGGSPCQGFSYAGQRLNFNDERSKLFFEYVRVLNELKEINPDIKFLLENVNMKEEWQNVISDYLNVKPILINSSLVSAQNRKRLYWTNFKFPQPEDKKIKLIDILENKNYLNKATIIGRRLNDRGVRDDYNKNIPITQCLEVRKSNIEKSNCITTVEKDNVLTSLPFGRHKDAFKNNLPFRYYTLKEYCRLQTIPDDYFDNLVSESQAKKMLGNGWTVDVISHIFRYL